MEILGLMSIHLLFASSYIQVDECSLSDSTFKLFFHGAIYTSIILLSTEATLDVMKYVGHNGIPVQECVQDVNGRFWTTETVADTHNDR
jgi:hypothetical protein